MIEISYNIILGARVSHSMMERHRDMDGCLPPSSILIHPFCLAVIIFGLVKRIFTQCFVDISPFCKPHVLWPKILIPNNGNEFSKVILRLLGPVVPIPITKEKCTFVWKWAKGLLITRTHRRVL